MKRIKSNFYKLHALKDAKPKLRKAIISNCDKELIHTISDCALNVLRGNVNLTDCQKKRLRKFKGCAALEKEKTHKSEWRIFNSTYISSLI